jgi:hypothetical protein
LLVYCNALQLNKGWQDLCNYLKNQLNVIMKNKRAAILLILFTTFLLSCTTSKNATNLKPTRSHLAGTWTISDIAVNMPAGYQVTDVFDEAPYTDFKGSTWNLIRNGNGSFALINGTKVNIYWGIYGSGADAQLEFKKLNSMKPKNVESGYRLKLGPISSNNFTATSQLDAGNNSTGSITYTFTKK